MASVQISPAGPFDMAHIRNEPHNFDRLLFYTFIMIVHVCNIANEFVKELWMFFLEFLLALSTFVNIVINSNNLPLAIKNEYWTTLT